MDVTLALILTFSPREKEQPLCVSGFANTCPANPVSVRRRTILLTKGNLRSGRSETVKKIFQKL